MSFTTWSWLWTTLLELSMTAMLSTSVWIDAKQCFIVQRHVHICLSLNFNETFLFSNDKQSQSDYVFSAKIEQYTRFLRWDLTSQIRFEKYGSWQLGFLHPWLHVLLILTILVFGNSVYNLKLRLISQHFSLALHVLSLFYANSIESPPVVGFCFCMSDIFQVCLYEYFSSGWNYKRTANAD